MLYLYFIDIHLQFESFGFLSLLYALASSISLFETVLLIVIFLGPPPALLLFVLLLKEFDAFTDMPRERLAYLKPLGLVLLGSIELYCL